MKRYLPILFSVVAAVFVTPIAAQVTAGELAGRAGGLSIPAAEGFIPVSQSFPRLFQRFVKTEPADSRVVEVYVDGSIRGDLIASEDSELHFYAKVSVPRQLRVMTETEFGILLKQLETQSQKFFDPSNPELKKATENIRKGLTEHEGQSSKFSVASAKDLGVFEHGPRLFSHMVLLNVEGRGGAIPLLATSSLLFIQRRVVFVQVYRRFTEVMDAETLRDFSKKWTAEILAANDPGVAGIR